MTTIKLKNGSGAPTAGDLVQGEPALDLTNKRLYTENASGTVIEVGTNPTSITTGDITATGTATFANLATSGDVTFGDNDKAIFGAGSDLQIYHDGFNSYMGDFGTGDLYLRASTNLYIGNSAGSASFITAADGGAVDLRYNGSAKLATTSTGIDVTGNIAVSSAGARRIDISNTSLADTGEMVSLQWDANADLTFQGRASDGTFKANWYRIEADASDGLADAHRFYTDSSAERMSITSTGIDVTGSISADGLTVESSSDPTTITLRQTGNTSGFILKNYNGNEAQLVNADNGVMVFKTNDLERMRIDSAGNVGIGTAPSNKLDIKGTVGFEATNSTNKWLAYTYTDNSLRLNYNGAGADEVVIDSGGNVILTKPNGAYLQFKDASAVRGAINVTTSDGLVFTTGASFTERMRIDSSGNVGIGTASPTANLEISAATSRKLDVVDTTGARVRLSTASGQTYVGSTTAHPLNIITNDAIRATIDSSGNVGFGTSSPRYNLAVSGNNATAIGIALDNASGSGTADISILGAGYASHQAGAGEVWFYSPDNINIGGATGNTNNIKFLANNNINMFIEGSSGNVGIGTASPSSYNSAMDDLVVAGSADSGITIASGTSSEGSLAFADGTSGADAYRGWINYNHNSNFMRFSTNATERMRIDSGGNVGIGTSSPSFGLSVESDNGSGYAALFRKSSSDPALAIQTTSGITQIQGLNSALNATGGIAMQLSGGNVGIGDPSPDTGLTIGSSFLTNSVAGASVKVKAIASSSILEIGQDGNNSALLTLTNSSGTETIRAAGHNGALTITGALSKGSGSFKIDHPLPSKTDTHHLVHSFVEAPQADNIYRGKVDLIDGSASVNIDAVAGMTEGTFVLLNRDVQCFTSNESGWTAVKGSVSGNILTITAQDNTCTDAISWLVIGERQDQHMHDTDWTDSNGKVIVEPSKGD